VDSALSPGEDAKVQRPALLPNPNPPLAGLDRVAHDINIPGGSLDLPAIRPAKAFRQVAAPFEAPELYAVFDTASHMQKKLMWAALTPARRSGPSPPQSRTSALWACLLGDGIVPAENHLLYLGKSGNLCYTIGSRQIEPGR
jgi:hypothetical protein